MTTCWIDPYKVDNDRWKLLGWQLFTGKFWEVAVYIAVVVLYTLVRVNLSRHVSSLFSIYIIKETRSL